MSGHDIIVIGASAGGVDALPRLMGSLPSSLPTSVARVDHSPQGLDLLPEILRPVASLAVAHGIDAEKPSRELLPANPTARWEPTRPTREGWVLSLKN